MIRFRDVSFSYDGADRPTLDHVDLVVAEGELCVVVGPTGSGKTTLLRAVNGLVPHFTGGRLSGEVLVDGRSTREFPPRELADVVGMVGQNPAASFVTDVVEDELAYTMENLGLDPAVMRRRVEDTLDLLGLHDLRYRPLGTLSGGQQQRVAIGAVLTASPGCWCSTNPRRPSTRPRRKRCWRPSPASSTTSGLTVLLAEHRLERVLPFADSVVLVPGGGGRLTVGPAAEIMVDAPVAPPLVELGRLAGWDPLPLSVRDARRLVGPLRDRLAGSDPPRAGPVPAGPAVARLDRATVRFGDITALDGCGLEFRSGEVVAIMGRNGSGKSTLLGQLAGVRAPTSGRVGGGGPGSRRTRTA